ncbi:YqeB family protein [Myceligenerans crystallogenes]
MTTTRLRQSPVVALILVGGGAVVGVLLGLFGPALARGLAGLIERTPFPVHSLVERLAALDQTWSLPLLGGAGLLGGIFLAVVAAESAELEVARDHLEHRQEKRETWVERAGAEALFRDGKDLIVLGPRGELRARLDITDLSRTRIDQALAADGWPLRDADPYDAAFEPWTDGRPGFTPDEHALLRDRREARKKKGERRAADEALAAAGLVARDRGDRLQVRRVRTARPAEPAKPAEADARGTNR